MPVTEMVIGVAIALCFLLGFIYLLRFFQAWLLHRTLRDALSRNSAEAGDLVDRIGRGDLGGGRAEPAADDRTGLVLIALAAALAGFSLIAGDPEWVRYGLGGALFPGLVGAALLIRHFLRRRSGEPDVAAGA